jgi:hypothetical protein
MKTPLNEIEQDSLRNRGILGQNEIAYRENNFTYAEDVLSSKRRMINTSNIVNEGKNLLLG